MAFRGVLMINISKENSSKYTNRELSWLKFEERVLEEAVDITNPLLQRAKFLGIFASNLDEFYMIRVASLKEMSRTGITDKDISGLDAGEQLILISDATDKLIKKQYEIYNSGIVKGLSKANIEIKPGNKLTGRQLKIAESIFNDKIYPILTPIVVEKNMPFPLVRNKSLNFCLMFSWQFDEEPLVGILQVPSVFGRTVLIEENKGKKIYVLVEDIIRLFIGRLFSNFKIENVQLFRVTRDADLSLVDDEAGDLLASIENKVKLRQWGDANRLEIEDTCDEKALEILRSALFLEKYEVKKVSGPLDLTFLFDIYASTDNTELKVHKTVGVWPSDINNNESYFMQIARKDILLFHPYESFEPVVEFIREAANDDNVLAIKQTLYRVSGDSPIVHNLALASRNGKQVTVLVELKARFDEENNIGWARMLESAGCHVIYGPANLKTHCKLALVVRKEGDELVRYTHLSTGNYNDTTAKQYTDIGLFTADKKFGEDATEVFNLLSGYNKPKAWNKFAVAPINLRDTFIKLINRERDNAKAGLQAGITAKLNSLCDKEIIDALYEASAAGVKIDLIVRGICCLKPGIQGLSDNITVRSIVGIFLEHSRIYRFENAGEPKYFLASADWMPRNMDRRIELLFPVENKELQEKLNCNLIKLLKDNRKARTLLPDGTYKVIGLNEKAYNCQQDFMDETCKN